MSPDKAAEITFPFLLAGAKGGGGGGSWACRNTFRSLGVLLM
jgi:hypothetical protein